MVIVCEQIEPTVGALAHVPDALAQFGQQGFPGHDRGALKLDAPERFPSQSPQKELASPSGELIAG